MLLLGFPPALGGGNAPAVFLREKQDDQAYRSCWLCLSHRNNVASNDPRAASTIGQLDHAGPVWLRPRYGHGEWPMHGQGSRPPGPQVYPMERKRLRRMAVTR